MENKYLQVAAKFYFMVIAVLMYYFITEVINLGLFVTYRHAFALALFSSAFCAFLYKPNIARGISSLKDAFVYFTPLIITITASLFIWFVGKADTAIISRGLSGSFFV